jgi:hypothetical protein
MAFWAYIRSANAARPRPALRAQAERNEKKVSVCMSVKTNVYKDKRAWRLSHEAFLTLQELASQQGLQTPAFLEVISRELALQRLSEEQRSRIKTEAERIADERKSSA